MILEAEPAAAEVFWAGERREGLRDKAAPMGIPVGCCAVAVDVADAMGTAETETFELDMALVGLPGVEPEVDAPTLLGDGIELDRDGEGAATVAAATVVVVAVDAAGAEEDAADPIRSRANASRARTEGFRWTVAPVGIVVAAALEVLFDGAVPAARFPCALGSWKNVGAGQSAEKGGFTNEQ